MALQEAVITNQTAGWMSIFPPDMKTLQESKTFVKQLTALAFSCITYMRSIFPEYAYQPKEIDNVKLKVLTGDYDCKDAYLMTRWIKSAFDALDNNYMRELVLEILSVDNKIIEYYTVSYKYNDGGPTCSFSANSQNLDFNNLELQNATKELIRTLLSSTEDLEELPRKYTLQLRVNYYDEVTPYRYKPKYFNHAKPCDYDDLSSLTRKEIGSIETPHHSLSVYCGSSLMSVDGCRQKFFHDLEIENTTNVVEESEDSVTSQSPVTQAFKDENSKINDWSWAENNSETIEEDPTEVDTQVADPTQPRLACVCRLSMKNDKDSKHVSSSTFQCIHCKSLQHMICYRKMIGTNEIKNGCCYNCVKLVSNAECTDSALKDCKPKKAASVAAFRQFLVHLQNLKLLTPKTLKDFGIPSDIIPNMTNKLKKDKLIKPHKGSNDSFVVNIKKLKNYIKNYFDA